VTDCKSPEHCVPEQEITVPEAQVVVIVQELALCAVKSKSRPPREVRIEMRWIVMTLSFRNHCQR
jgi:hypothetical protein